MIIKMHKKIIAAIAAAVTAGLAVLAVWGGAALFMRDRTDGVLAGGRLRQAPCLTRTAQRAVNTQPAGMEIQRFNRPSRAEPYPNPCYFQDFMSPEGSGSMAGREFREPEEVILAYYGIIREASCMLGYSGGCGSIGQGDAPYPYAYELLAPEKQKQMTLKQFKASFKGVGHVTLLKLIPVYSPPGTPDNIRYYMAETEIITGQKAEKEKDYSGGSLFAYYYGLVTAERSGNGDGSGGGWKIRDIEYIPEAFLCAPEHGWFYLSDGVVEIVYGDNLGITEKTDKTGRDGDMVYVYASGHGKSYRFDFVRLTNGYDILLTENVLENGQWVRTELLTDQWKYLKLTPRQ